MTLRTGVLADVQIAIVGAGPAGASLALHLVHYAPQLRDHILVIDKATFPRDKICAGAIGGRADQLLAQIGVYVDVPSAPIHGLQAISTAGKILRMADYPIGRVVRRHSFDAALAAELGSRGIATWFGCGVQGFEVHTDGVVVETERGKLRAAALIGADGVGSLVRRGIGLPQRQVYAQAIEVDTPWRPDDAPKDVLAFDLLDTDEPGYAWDFPTVVNGRSMVCRGIYRVTRGLSTNRQASLPPLSEQLRRRLLRQGLEVDGLAFRQFAERGLPLHALVGRERVLLVGDAAGIDPVLGEGIAQAIFYGEAAARYLVAAVGAGDLRFGGYRAFMARQRIGVDLRLRAAALPWMYGSTRRRMERWIQHSEALCDAGMAYFAGRRVPRAAMGRAALDLFHTLSSS